MLSKEELKKFTGIYKLQNVRLRIFDENGKLMGKPEGSNEPTESLIHHGYVAFSLKEMPRQGLRFENVNGSMWVQFYWDGFFQGFGRREQ
jgi:hypothetical protein